jgi:SAM-dependent methyltransferase
MDQKQYWNSNLQADNLERVQTAAGSEGLERELAFSDSPDQVEARAFLGGGGGRVCLEIGSGLGANAVRLSEDFSMVIATDLAIDRLREMRNSLPDAVGSKIFPVACRGEHLPFRDGVIVAAFSRSVLIHTDVELAAAECRRVLAPGGRIGFVEPLRHNPLVNLYRNTLAPAIWKSIPSYFDQEEIGAVEASFPGVEEKRFYLAGFLAFAWQYALPCRWLFYLSLRILGAVDATIFGIFPGAKKFAWFTVLTAVRPEADHARRDETRVAPNGDCP